MAEIQNEIHATLAISQNEAFTGTIRTLTLTNGQQVAVTIPPGSLNGQILRIPSQGSKRLLLTLAITQENTPQMGAYPPYGGTPSPLAPPPPPGASRPNNYGNYQFSEFVPGGQIPYPAPTFPDSQSYPAYPHSPNTAFFQGRALPAQPGQMNPPPVLPPGTPKKRKYAALLYTLLIFLVLTIIVGSALTYLFGSYVPRQEHTQATAAAQNAATTTVRTQVTATTRANNAATVQANATATVIAPYIDAYNKITATAPILSDNLGTPSVNNWDTDTGCTFTDTSYHAVENDSNYLRDCIAETTNFSNFAYQIQMTILKGDFGGLIFRANSDSGKMYMFLIDSVGNYIIYYYPDHDGKNARTLDSGASTSFVQGYNQQNLLTVIAKGAALDFYINKQYLTSVQESSSSAGQIGVLANYKNMVTEVSYTQARIWSIT